MKKIVLMQVATCFFLLVAGVVHAEKYEVTGKLVVVRKGPAASEMAVTSVSKGQVVDGSINGRWVSTLLPDGSMGYISAKFVKPVAGSNRSEDGAVDEAGNTDFVDFASPITTSVSTRTRLRKEQNDKGLVYRYLASGEPVKVMGGGGGWAKVETKWQFESGKPMVGFVRAADLPEDVVKNTGITLNGEKRKEVGAKRPLDGGGAHPPAMQRVVNIIPPEPTRIDLKAMESANEILSTQLKTTQAENAKLKAEATRHSGEIKAVRAALASADSRLRQSEEDRRKLSAELKNLEAKHLAVTKELKEALAGGKNKLLLMADNGEAVYFKGVGEALMAAGDGLTVLRFPLSAANKADKIFIGAKAERRLQGAYAYYVVDTKLLAF